MIIAAGPVSVNDYQRSAAIDAELPAKSPAKVDFSAFCRPHASVHLPHCSNERELPLNFVDNITNASVAIATVLWIIEIKNTFTSNGCLHEPQASLFIPAQEQTPHHNGMQTIHAHLQKHRQEEAHA